MREELKEQLLQIGELLDETQEVYKQKCIEFWNSLSPDDQLMAFYIVTSKLTQGELKDQGTYRYILYDVFNFGMESYHVGMMSGFMELHNNIDPNSNKETKSDKKDKFQYRVDEWLMDCFGYNIARDKRIRNHRFLEESLELVQACGCTKEDALRLVDYVYNRDIGEIDQEVGGVATTLAALCLAQDVDLDACAETELVRVKNNIEKIREKSKKKPDFSKNL